MGSRAYFVLLAETAHPKRILKINYFENNNAMLVAS